MSYHKYLTYDVAGGILWVGSMIFGGYAVGKLMPNLGGRIHYVILAVIFLSLLPGIIGALRARGGKSVAPISPRAPDSNL
jgi:membrane-associated protein